MAEDDLIEPPGWTPLRHPRQAPSPGRPTQGFVTPGPAGLGGPGGTAGSTGAKFVPKQSNHGFDRVGRPGGDPWQMVPKGGSRGVLLEHGADCEVKLFGDDNSIVSVKEVTSRGDPVREFWIAGHAEGLNTLFALHPTKKDLAVAAVRAGVFAATKLRVGFHLLSHDGGQQKTKRTCKEVDEKIFPTAAKIFRLQTNLHLEKVRCEPWKVQKDLSNPQGFVTFAAIKEEIDKRDWPTDEDVHVILVAHFETAVADETHGMYYGTKKTALIEDVKLKDAGQIVAHEIGHHVLGLDHVELTKDNLNLMIAGSSQIIGFTIHLMEDQAKHIQTTTRRK